MRLPQEALPKVIRPPFSYAAMIVSEQKEFNFVFFFFWIILTGS
jgi:hypothetical protein